MVLAVVSLLWAFSGAGAPDDAAVVLDAAPKKTPSSVQAFVDDVAAALQDRATRERIAGGIRIVLAEVRGLDPKKTRAALPPRIKKALVGGPLVAAESAPLTATVAISAERGYLWAVVVIDGPAGVAPSTVVVRRSLDRELEVALGTVSRLLPGRYALQRVASLPTSARGARPCPLLDAALVDVEGDALDELAVLTVCDVSVYAVDDGGVSVVAGPVALPARRWPRVTLGWLASWTHTNGGPRLWLATSAGHSLMLDLGTGQFGEAPAERIPLRGVAGPDGPFALHWRLGSPVLSFPLVTPGGVDVVVPGLPARVRDLARVPGTDGWVFVSDDGALMGRDGGGGPLAPERVGDRVLVVDLDSDGDIEVLTTTSASPGEPDQLVVRRLDSTKDGSRVVLRSSLGGGSVAAFSAGRLDDDRRIDVVVVEESVEGDVSVWRLEHSP